MEKCILWVVSGVACGYVLSPVSSSSCCTILVHSGSLWVEVAKSHTCRQCSYSISSIVSGSGVDAWLSTVWSPRWQVTHSGWAPCCWQKHRVLSEYLASTGRGNWAGRSSARGCGNTGPGHPEIGARAVWGRVCLAKTRYTPSCRCW
jgi:hypothetical protein